MSRPRAKILVIRGGAIGDFILTLPVLTALRRQFPEVHLEVLGYPHIAQLAVDGGVADAVHFIEARPLATFFARNGQLGDDMVRYFSEFNLIVSYLYDPDAIFQTNVARCTKAQFIAGPHRPDEKAGVHATKVFLKPLETLAIFDPNPVPVLKFKPESTSCPAGTVALMPGSGSEAKNWPEANWAELVTLLGQRESLLFLIIGGEAEGDLLDRLAALLPEGRRQVARSLPLSQLGARLQSCSAFIGHDSGISHLAAAVGLPGVILWGDTVKEVWRPPSQRISILHHPSGLARLPADQVLPGVLRLLGVQE